MTKSVSSLSLDTKRHFEDAWGVIHSEGIQKLQDFLDAGADVFFTNQEKSRLYTLVYNLSISKENLSPCLYQRYEKVLQSYLRLKAIDDIFNSEGDLGQIIVQKWRNHQLMVRWMRIMFSYLDRFHVKFNALSSLHDRGFQIFQKEIIERLQNKLTSYFEDQLQNDRLYKSTNLSKLREISDMLIALAKNPDKDKKLYEDIIEKPVKQSSKNYYAALQKELAADSNCGQYFQRVEATLEAEGKRLEHSLHHGSVVEILKIFQREMLMLPQRLLFEQEHGIKEMFAQRQYENLSRIFRLYLPNEAEGGLEPLGVALKNAAFLEGTGIIEELDKWVETQTQKVKSKAIIDDFAIVPRLIALYDVYAEEFVAKCFASNKSLALYMSAAFENFMNQDIQNGNLPGVAQLLALYVDKLIRKGVSSSGGVEDVVQMEFVKVVKLFSYISDKDLFIEELRGHLSKRLLQLRGVTHELEKELITLIKLTCGAQITSKLEGMINDLEASGLVSAKWSNYLLERDTGKLGVPELDNMGQVEEKKVTQPELDSLERVSKSAIDFTVTVLTTGHWPSFVNPNLMVPPPIFDHMSVFKLFWGRMTTHKVLNFQMTQGIAELVATYLPNNPVIAMALPQAAILLLFNEAKELSFSQIQSKLDFDPQFLKIYLHSLIFGKAKILKKTEEEKSDEKGPAIYETDVVKMNESFISVHKRMMLTAPILKQEQSSKKIVIQDRSIAVEAAIVRVMKSRRSMEHTQLMQEVMQLLQGFKPAPKLIKERIENLIERDYVERDSDNASIYKYVA